MTKHLRFVLRDQPMVEQLHAIEQLASSMGLQWTERRPGRATWRAAVGDTPLVQLSFDAVDETACLEIVLDDRLAEAGAWPNGELPWQRLPIANAQDLLHTAEQSWHDDPVLLERAAWGADDATQGPIAQLVFAALRMADESTWRHAVVAGTLLAPAERHWLFGMALALEADAARRLRLQQVADLDVLATNR